MTEFVTDLRQKRKSRCTVKLDKEIPDISEYILFGSGRLVFYPTSERRALILENVMGVNHVEKKIKHLLEALEVRIENN